MIYTTRRIALPELRHRQLAHPDFADSGWAVVGMDGDDEEEFVDWYADQYAATVAACQLNDDDTTECHNPTLPDVGRVEPAGE